MFESAIHRWSRAVGWVWLAGKPPCHVALGSWKLQVRCNFGVLNQISRVQWHNTLSKTLRTWKDSCYMGLPSLSYFKGWSAAPVEYNPLVFQPKLLPRWGRGMGSWRWFRAQQITGRILVNMFVKYVVFSPARTSNLCPGLWSFGSDCIWNFTSDSGSDSVDQLYSASQECKGKALQWRHWIKRGWDRYAEIAAICIMYINHLSYASIC